MMAQLLRIFAMRLVPSFSPDLRSKRSHSPTQKSSLWYVGFWSHGTGLPEIELSDRQRTQTENQRSRGAGRIHEQMDHFRRKRSSRRTKERQTRAPEKCRNLSLSRERRKSGSLSQVAKPSWSCVRRLVSRFPKESCAQDGAGPEYCQRYVSRCRPGQPPSCKPRGVFREKR